MGRSVSTKDLKKVRILPLWKLTDMHQTSPMQLFFFKRFLSGALIQSSGKKSIVVANQAKERTKCFYICWDQHMFYCWDIFWLWFSIIFVKYKPKVFDFVPEKFTLLTRNPSFVGKFSLKFSDWRYQRTSHNCLHYFFQLKTIKPGIEQWHFFTKISFNSSTVSVNVKSVDCFGRM